MGCDAKSIPTGVSWDDVQSWERIGHRWAKAYDRDRNFVAIYDLSYPDLFRQISLGFLSFSTPSFAKFRDQIDQAPLREGDGDLKSRSLEAIDQLVGSVSKAPADSAPWWSGLKWKSRIAVGPTRPPEGFGLGDIDFESMSSDPDRFRELLAQILGAESLSDFRMARQTSG